jgi:hypothetical protein
MRTPHVYLPVIGLLVLASLVTAGRSLSAARSGPQLSDVAGARYRLDAATAKSSGARLLAQDVRRAGFRFAPTVAPTDRQAFLDAVGAARPEARRLIGLVDALLTDDVTAVLDAGIPAGLGCEEGLLGGCATRQERFAESFAKWALGDIGVNLEIGYKVPPPSAPLDVWGAPLARLAASG